mgnify:CR=1 FL=1
MKIDANFSVNRGDFRLNIDTIFSAGAVTAVLGPNGSGKSTLLRVLAGLQRIDSGEIVFGDQVVNKAPSIHVVPQERSVGVVFQDYALFPHMTVFQNISFSIDHLSKKSKTEKVTSLLELINLNGIEKKYPHQLSGGEQQRVAIARAFAAQAPILFADEPTGNLDTQTGDHIVELLFELNQQHHTTLVLVTHDLNLAQRCQRRLTLNAGQLTERLDA